MPRAAWVCRNNLPPLACMSRRASHHVVVDDLLEALAALSKAFLQFMKVTQRGKKQRENVNKSDCWLFTDLKRAVFFEAARWRNVLLIKLIVPCSPLWFKPNTHQQQFGESICPNSCSLYKNSSIAWRRHDHFAAPV